MSAGSLTSWIVAFVIAVFVFFVAQWLLGIVATMIPAPFKPPAVLVTLASFVIALILFVGVGRRGIVIP